MKQAAQLKQFYLQNNLFYYKNETAIWLDQSSKTVDLCNDVRTAFLECSNEEAKVYAKLVSRTEKIQDMLTDLVVLGAAAKAGLRTGVPAAMVPGETGRLVGQGRIVGGIPFSNEERVMQWSEEYQGAVEAEAKECVQDMALMWIVYKGVKRKRLKIEHDLGVLLDVIYNRLFVPVARLKDNIQELVFKGLWDRANQATLDRIMGVFVRNLSWSNQARAEASKFAKLANDIQYVSDAQGKQFRQSVELQIKWSGGGTGGGIAV